MYLALWFLCKTHLLCKSKQIGVTVYQTLTLKWLPFFLLPLLMVSLVVLAGLERLGVQTRLALALQSRCTYYCYVLSYFFPSNHLKYKNHFSLSCQILTGKWNTTLPRSSGSSGSGC